jgi:hypothetical protein
MSKNFGYTLYVAAFTTHHTSPYPEPYETIVHNLCEFITKMNSSIKEEVILG